MRSTLLYHLVLRCFLPKYGLYDFLMVFTYKGSQRFHRGSISALGVEKEGKRALLKNLVMQYRRVCSLELKATTANLKALQLERCALQSAAVVLLRSMSSFVLGP